MHDIELHRRLIGRQGGRAALNTPALVVDRDALGRNIAAMAAFAAESGAALRPHAKTHKSVEIARLQIEAGAAGVCCAKLGEAEALAAGGVQSITITSPVVTPQAIERLTALNARIAGLRLAVDHAENVAALEHAARSAGRPLSLLIDIDPGIRRTGVVSAEAAAELAEAVSGSAALSYAGVQFYCGAQQHIESHAERRAAIAERTGYLQEVIALLEARGLAPEIVTGGGTGSHRIDAELGVLTEWQVGSYVFMDRQYGDCDLTGDGAKAFESALFVDAHVISANSPGMGTVDAGFKALSTDGGAATVVAGAPADAKFFFMGDEHGALLAPGHSFRIGDRVVLAPPHCDPTVNLYDCFHVVSGGTLVDIWPIQGRGRSR